MDAPRLSMFEQEFGQEQSVDQDTAGALAFTSEGHSVQAAHRTPETGPPAATALPAAVTGAGEMIESEPVSQEPLQSDTRVLAATSTDSEVLEAGEGRRTPVHSQQATEPLLAQAKELPVQPATAASSNGRHPVIIVTDSARAIQRIRDVLHLPNIPNSDKVFDTSMLPDSRHTEIRKSMGIPPMEHDRRAPYFVSESEITTATLRVLCWLHHKMHKEVQIIWVPGHTGIEGNERADIIAAYARCRGQDHHAGGLHDRPIWYLWQRDAADTEEYRFGSRIRDLKAHMDRFVWDSTRPVANYEQTMPSRWIEDSIEDYAQE
ncbi:hypothetical protein AMS68_003775 [Peltaster fructicola]|uniref:RNase H type-1 domain-containing protein n=1 Tax=Peltaster fructicola TaxID=286661 RepID=A0A6H0XUG6_9PEZI|nr:hypothetical protein AMS68_003775 [Peltaster fructicola]